MSFSQLTTQIKTERFLIYISCWISYNRITIWDVVEIVQIKPVYGNQSFTNTQNVELNVRITLIP